MPFVGRQAELAALTELWEEARSGHPQVVLIEGPAGIGKTALVRQLNRGALGITGELGPGEGCVLWASGEEDEAHLPFGVLDQLVAAASDALSGADAGIDQDAGVDGRADDALAAGATLIDLLGALQRAGPVIVVVDDVHWADQPSLRALTFALRRLRVDRVLTVVTVRDLVEAQMPDGLRRLLSDEQTGRIQLAGLPSADLSLLSARSRTGQLSRRAVDRLQAHTGGNPLHARALLAQIPAETFDDLANRLPVPRSFAMLMLGRLASCPPDGRELALAASVLGTHCPLRHAAVIADLDEPLAALDQAVTAGLLVEHLAADEVRFPHPLVQAAVYQHLGSVRRAELHGRAAHLEVDQAVRLQHRTRATPGPDADLAADLAQLGRDEVVAGSWSTAADHLAAAARMSPTRPGREQLTLEAAECQLLSGDVPDVVGKTAEIATFQRTAWRDYLLARFAFGRGDLDEAEALLRDAWQRCDPAGGADPDPRLGARVSAWLAAIHSAKLDGAGSAIWARRAQTLDRGTVFDLIRQTEITARAMSGHLDATLAELTDLPHATAASVTELDALLGRGILHTWADDLASAQRDLAGVLAGSQGRSLLFKVFAAMMLGQAEFRAGRWDDATLHCDLALSIMADSDHANLAPFCHTIAVFVPAARGQWDQAQEHVQRSQAFAVSRIAATTVYAAIATAHVARAQGRPADIVAALAPVVGPGVLDLAAEPGVLSWQEMLIDAYVDTEDFDRAQAALEVFETAAAGFGRASAISAARRSRGILEARRGNHGEADAAFQASLEAAPLDQPFQRALVRFAYGSFLRRLGKRATAGTHLQAAWETFAALDARPFLSRCQRELAACGWSSGGDPGEHDAARLTNQELAVAKLVATGLTNRKVARELVVSEKTVEYHLRNVFAKLNVTSRTQLARRFTDE